MLRAGARAFFRRVFLSAFSGGRGGELWVVDIDNTIADTWPSFSAGFASESERLSSLRPLEGMCARIRAAVPQRASVVFVTLRPYAAYFVTRKWLKAQGLPCGPAEIVLVEKPEAKLELLEEAFERFPGRRVEYYDDLSYGHEKGEMKLYSGLIGRAKALPMKYFGYEELAGINAGNGETL